MEPGPVPIRRAHYALFDEPKHLSNLIRVGVGVRASAWEVRRDFGFSGLLSGVTFIHIQRIHGHAKHSKYIN